MATSTEGPTSLSCRQALEALRNGVPNGAAVKMLGCNQPRAEGRFQDLLSRASDRCHPPPGALGMVVSGDFGSGKSHLLTHFEQQALDRGFVCSRVAISKETPLYDLGRVFKSAMDNGRMPGRSGRFVEELAQDLKPDSPRYAEFRIWAERTQTNHLSPIFPASLLVHERSRELELNSEIENFWAGERILISRIKGGLRQIRQSGAYSFRAPKAADLPAQRLRFAVELVKAAGYRGWVVLLDEIELVSSYSLLQRGRAYAELSRWFGVAGGEHCPGLVTVGTVTEDFHSVVIKPSGEKKDHDRVDAKLSASRYRGLEESARHGMRLLEEGESTPLASPTEADIRETLEKLRDIYSTAYDWQAPPAEHATGGAGFQNRMRYKVRSAINQWDLLRLYPDSIPDVVSDEFRPSYEEDRDLERQSGADAE